MVVDFILWDSCGHKLLHLLHLTFIVLFQHDGQIVEAVAARSKESAEDFGKKFGVKKCYANYSGLEKDNDIGMFVGNCIL